MIKSFLNKILPMLAAGAMLTACDSYMDDNWTPGEQVAEGVQGAFFSTDNATAYSVSEDTEFGITIQRIDSTEAATVPVNIVSRDTTAINIPASVTFEAGKGTATLTCSAEGLTEDSLYSFTIAIDDSQVSPYAAGASTYTATVINGSLWKDVVVDAPTYFYYGGKYTFDFTYKTTIQQYLNTNYFYVKDFLNSGSGFTFKLKVNDEYYPEAIDLDNLDEESYYLEPVDEEGTSFDDYGSYSQYTYYAIDDDGNASWGWTDTVNNVTWDYWYWYYSAYGNSYSTLYKAKYIELLGYAVIGGKYYYTGLYIDWRSFYK